MPAPASPLSATPWWTRSAAPESPPRSPLPARPAEPLPRSAASRRLPQEVLRDDDALDLARALVDRRHARVSVVALDRVFPRIAVAPEDLHRARRNRVGGLRGVDLGHRGLLREAHA